MQKIGTMENKFGPFNETSHESVMTMNEVILLQMPVPGGWICPGCEHHRSNLICKRNVLITAVGANLSGCCFYSNAGGTTADLRRHHAF
jgi:hypothetical protein